MPCVALNRILQILLNLGLLPFRNLNKLHISSSYFLCHLLLVFGISLFSNFVFVKILADRYNIAIIIQSVTKVIWCLGFVCDILLRLVLFFNRYRIKALLCALFQISNEFCEQFQLNNRIEKLKASIDKALFALFVVVILFSINIFNLDPMLFNQWHVRLDLALSMFKLFSSAIIDLFLISLLELILILLNGIHVSKSNFSLYFDTFKLLKEFLKCFQSIFIVGHFYTFLTLTHGLYILHFYVTIDFDLTSIFNNLQFFGLHLTPILNLVLSYKFACVRDQVS